MEALKGGAGRNPCPHPRMKKKLSIHPHALLLPRMTAKEQAALSYSLRTRGQVEPIIVDDKNQIIDGVNRSSLLIDMGIELKIEVFKGKEDEILDHILDKNLNRRQLTPGQCAAVAAELATVRRKEQRKKTVTDVTLTEAAKRIGATRQLVHRVIKILDKSPLGLFKAVKNGKLEVNTAMQALELSPDDQTAISVAKNPKAEFARRKSKKPMAAISALAKIIEQYKNLTEEEQQEFLTVIMEPDFLA